MIIVGGANGAGKTTFVKKYLEKNLNVSYLSADAIAEELSPNNMTAAKIKAGRLFLDRLDNCISSKENFLVESTLSGQGLTQYIKKARSYGMPISLIYVFHESIEVCINRVRERVLAGGHDVPKKDIIRRYKRSLYNFWNIYKNIVDDWHLMYNSNIDLALVCVGKRDQEINIIDDNLFQLFKKAQNERR